VTVVAAAIAVPMAFGGPEPAASEIGSANTRGQQLSGNVATPFGRGCADFGLVFYIDTCVSRPTARVSDFAYDDVATPFGRGCADFGLVFYIDTCVSRPTARVSDVAYDGDYMFRDLFRETHWQRRST
jgi:hypothetical protein